MRIGNSVFFRKTELRNFCTYRFIFGISYSLMIPIIPLFFDSIGMETVVIGTVMSLYGVSKTLAQMPFGIISDRIGDKLSLKLSIGLMAFVPIGYTLTNNTLAVGALYVIQGAVLGMAAPATYSILARSLDSRRRGECTGFASAVFTFSGGIGAAIAGYIVTQLNDYNTVFYLASFGVFITLIYISLKITKVKVSKACGGNKVGLICILEELRRKGLMHKVLVLGSIAFLGDYIYSCVIALFHFYGQDVLGASVSYTSSIISVYLLVFGLGAPIAGYVSDKIGNKKQLFLSFTVMNLTLLSLIIIRSIPVFTVVIIMYFLGATFLNAALQSSLSEFGDNHIVKGFVFGFVGSSESLGYALGPLISAYIYEINKNYLFLGLLIVSVLVTALYIIFFNKAKI